MVESQSWQYDVALSYAGEDRVHARELAKRIQTAGYSVFYDEFEELWGEDLSVKLHEVYGKQSRFCVAFVSKHYLKKPWTNVERKAVLARAMQQDTAYLLPIRLEDSDLPGFAGVTAVQGSPPKVHRRDLRIAEADPGTSASRCGAARETATGRHYRPHAPAELPSHRGA